MFVCEDDVFAASLSHPELPPIRLTLDQCCEHPVLSPDGKFVAYTNYVRTPPLPFSSPRLFAQRTQCAHGFLAALRSFAARRRFALCRCWVGRPCK